MTERLGEIYDIGYQRYEGPREGRSRARQALWSNGVRNSLGIGRGWMSKALPILLMIALLIPVLVFTLIASISGGQTSGVGHAEYYGFAAVILLIFSGIIAPELLCPDRRSGVLNLYLVRPLSVTDYVAGRWLAFFSVTLVFVYVPQIALFLGLTLGTADPAEYVKANWLDIPRFAAAGFVVALFTTTVPLSVAAFTTRRAFASAIVIGLWLVSTAVGNALSEIFSGDAAAWSSLVAVGSLPIHINDMIFGSASDSDLAQAARELPREVIIAWYLVLIIGPASALWYRYKRLVR